MIQTDKPRNAVGVVCMPADKGEEQDGKRTGAGSL